LVLKIETVEAESGEEEGEEGEEEPVELLTVKKQLLESSWCGLLSALGKYGYDASVFRIRIGFRSDQNPNKFEIFIFSFYL
jgi:hypothetical protein